MRNNTERVVFYRWDDITNLLNQKRMFGIECQRSEENVQFYFDDPEAARYVWKLAVLQVSIFFPHYKSFPARSSNNFVFRFIAHFLQADTVDASGNPVAGFK